MKRTYSIIQNSIIEHSTFAMKNFIFSLTLLALASSTFAQSDEINISASFEQSIELRVIGNASINFTFSTIEDYTKGKFTSNTGSGFEVSSSTNFSVQISSTPMVNPNGDELDIENLSFDLAVDEDLYPEKGVRWDIPTSDYERFDWTYHAAAQVYRKAFFVASQTPKTIVVPGPSGNAGGFEKNRFYLIFWLGFYLHLDMMGKPRLLDQNIQPGTYTCTMTLTAIPSVS